MIPLVIDMNTKDTCKDLVQDFSTARFHEHLNQNTAMRKSHAAQEAQEAVRAAKSAERAEDIYNARKFRSVSRLAVTAGVIGVLAYAHATLQISNALFIYSGFAASMCFGWCLNNTVRLFRRKHREHRKG